MYFLCTVAGNSNLTLSNYPCHLIGSHTAQFLIDISYRSAKSTHQLDDFDPARPCQREDLVLELHRHRHPETPLRPHRAQSYRFITEGCTLLWAQVYARYCHLIILSCLLPSWENHFNPHSFSILLHSPPPLISLQKHSPSIHTLRPRRPSARADEDDG